MPYVIAFILALATTPAIAKMAGGFNSPIKDELMVTQSGKAIEIYGGYHRDATDPTNNTVERDPLTYRSIINGNTEAKDIKEGLYHCITVQQGAKLVLDGFHVINGYAAGNKVVHQLIDLALLQNNMLKGEALTNFVKRSIEMI